MSYGWRITKDRLDKKEVNIIGPRGVDNETCSKLLDGQGKEFRVLDDDGMVYFEGRFIGDNESEDGFGPLDDFGESYGCTEIQYKEDGSWMTL